VNRQRFYRTLYGQVLVATAVGVLLGHFWPAAGLMMRPLGDGFIKLVRMTIAPIVFCTVVVGIAGGGGMRMVGKAGGFALVYFEVVSTLALVIGLLVVNVVQPGAGMNVDPRTLDSTAVAQYVSAGRAQSAAAFVIDIIPTSVVDAFVRGDVLQVLLFSTLFAVALRISGARGVAIFELIEQLSSIFFTIVAGIMKAAPLGAFGAMAFTIGSYGVGTLAQLGKLVACFYLTCFVFVFIVLGGIARWHGFAIWRLIACIREEIFIVFGTSSSESVLPRIMEKLQGLGVPRPVVGLVIPAGYSFNLDGTAIYLSIATVFIAQATNTDLGPARQLTLLALLLITSKGSAGVAGAALIVLAATLAATGVIPVAGVALVLGIHRFMGEAMAVTNLIGNSVATIVVARWCGELDEARLANRLAGAALAPVEDAEQRRDEMQPASVTLISPVQRFRSRK
jgi:aerobic C4-dicarboxylate transport protein